MRSGRAKTGWIASLCEPSQDLNIKLETVSSGGSFTVIGIGATLNRRFLLEKELGRGGMGAVYSANDQLLERKVAIKVLKEQSGEEVGKRLRLEAQIAARLLHENVVRIYDFGQADEDLVFPGDGRSQWQQLFEAVAASFLARAAECPGALWLTHSITRHHQGVVHRDVKPANVLLTSTDSPKLSDFGLSIIAFSEEGEKSGVIRGTPHYMSPEQTRGTKLDFRTDLYSLGVMLYESATGSVPFTGSSMTIMSQHYSVPPDRPRSATRCSRKNWKRSSFRFWPSGPQTGLLPAAACAGDCVKRCNEREKREALRHQDLRARRARSA